jgi:alpha-amylase/alpha-mannosidase (GH57 family)
LLEHNEWEAKEILWALDRMPRSLWEHEGLARVHLTLSGTLLETLSSSDFQSRVYGIAKCGDLLWHLQNTNLFHILGMAYYHSVLPLIPQADWDEQLGRWLSIGRHIFNRDYFPGFWPPEMGFSMEMIPTLKRFGYRYVLVDSNYIEPIDEMNWADKRYLPHVARYEDEEIVIIVRDRELSDAQESGMEFGWFEHELHERTKFCSAPPLVTTCTDGDNGGWFRNTSPKGNFWNVFYDEFMTQIRNDWTVVRPIFIDEYLNQYGTYGEVTVNEGAWNTGWHHGKGFLQWTGSQAQKDALQRVRDTSAAFHALREKLEPTLQGNPHGQYLLNEAQWRLLRAETSCNFYWGEAWVQRAHDDLDAAWHHLNELQQ